eukprot:s994_g12.t1
MSSIYMIRIANRRHGFEEQQDSDPAEQQHGQHEGSATVELVDKVLPRDQCWKAACRAAARLSKPGREMWVVTSKRASHMAPWDASSPNAMLHVLSAAEATRHQNKAILRNAFDWRQLLHLAEELPDAAHALNVCTILHRLAKGGMAGRSQGGEEWDWEALGIFVLAHWCGQEASKGASKGASKQASKGASEQASQPARKEASQPAR